jgi:multidrug efflux pump subunit AcrA (membrane-fusion protein)
MNRFRVPLRTIATIALPVLGIGLVLAIASFAGLIRIFNTTSRNDIITHKVGYESLQLTITERGQLESAENKDVVCRVKARSASSTIATTIRWVIEDGTQVKKGDKLAELDDSGLHTQLQTQKIALDQAYAALINAEKSYEIVESQNKSDLATAKLTLELAEIDLQKYKKGELIQQTQEIEGRLMIARSDLAMWEERSSWSGRMSKPGRRYVTVAQAQADEARLKSAKIALAKVEEEKRVLLNYMGPRTEKDLQGKIDEAKRAMTRVDAQAKAKEVQADAERKSKKSIYEQELVRTQDIEDEIRKCVIYAPQSGLVVYYVSEQSRFGSGSQQSIIAQGEPVREGQKLMRIPDLTKMVVNTRVHEAMINRVRGEKVIRTGFSDSVQAGFLFMHGFWPRLTGQKALHAVQDEFLEAHNHLETKKIAEGQSAVVRVDALPDLLMQGEVKTVATVASQQDWMSADVKVYQTMVTIKDSISGLKPGMSAEVKIQTDAHRDHCLTIPIQAIMGTVDMGNTRRVYVKSGSGTVAKDVVIGLSNEKMAEVVSGLSEGDEVVVNARVLLSDKEKTQLSDAPKGDKGMGKGGEKGAGAKGKNWPGKPESL